MATIPPVMLVLDISTLSAASPQEWLEFSRVGSCIIPQVVYEEMKFLFDRTPDPDLERIARAFTRFYPTSGWQISDGTAHHALLKSTAGQALTKRARVSLAVGRCAYAIAQSFPGSLVVLVSSDRSMLQRIYDVQANNLCAITGQALLQWSRTGQRPITVSQKMQQIRATSGAQSGIPTVIQSYQPTSPSRITSSPKTTIPNPRTVIPNPKTAIPSTSLVPSKNTAQERTASANRTSGLTALISSIALLAIVGFLTWAIAHASGFKFNQLLPPVPSPAEQPKSNPKS